MHRRTRVFVLGASFALLLALGLGLAPQLYAEYALPRHGPLIGDRPEGPAAGRWVDDYFIVQSIDGTTYAIGEPRYYQGNYSYLILGAERAVLFDAGTGARDLVPVVRALTQLPVTVIPSHLHFDHVGALGRLDRTALVDDATLRARVRGSQLTLERYEFLGFADGLAPPTFRVDEWWKPGSEVELGGRRLRVLATPGHTPTSVSLYDAARDQLYVGDFFYPGLLYAFVPGASRRAYLDTARRLLALAGPGTRIFTAHMADAPAPVAAPVMGRTDLAALEAALVAIDTGRADATGFFPRVYPVSEAMRFATGFPWNNR